MDKVLQELVVFMKEASPFVWSTLIKQVYVEAVVNIFWAIIFIALCVTLAKLGNHGRKIYEEDKHSDWEDGQWFAYVGSAMVGIIAFMILMYALMRFANPEFYAIRYIISQFGGG